MCKYILEALVLSIVYCDSNQFTCFRVFCILSAWPASSSGCLAAGGAWRAQPGAGGLGAAAPRLPINMADAIVSLMSVRMISWCIFWCQWAQLPYYNFCRPNINYFWSVVSVGTRRCVTRDLVWEGKRGGVREEVGHTTPNKKNNMKTYWKWSFPLIRSIRRSVGWNVCLLVGLS